MPDRAGESDPRVTPNVRPHTLPAGSRVSPRDLNQLAREQAQQANRLGLVDMRYRPRAHTPLATTVQWMKLTVVSGATLKGKLVDADGDPGTNLEQVIMVLVSSTGGLVTANFNFNTCVPKLAIGNIVPVMELGAAGSTRLAGYWLVWYLINTCY